MNDLRKEKEFYLQKIEFNMKLENQVASYIQNLMAKLHKQDAQLITEVSISNNPKEMFSNFIYFGIQMEKVIAVD